MGNGDRNYLTLFGINRFLHEKLNVMCTALQEKTAWGTRLRLKHFIKNKKIRFSWLIMAKHNFPFLRSCLSSWLDSECTLGEGSGALQPVVPQVVHENQQCPLWDTSDCKQLPWLSFMTQTLRVLHNYECVLDQLQAEHDDQPNMAQRHHKHYCYQSLSSGLKKSVTFRRWRI